MRFLTGILVVGTLLWGGYWVFGARGIENALAQWFDDRRGEGWVAEAATINTAGFPNRFDTSLVDLELADPDTGLAWRLPLLQILTLSYSPNHIILALPRTFSVSSPAERISITNAQMRGSVVFVPNTALTLDRSSFELSDVEISSSKAWQTKIATGQLATARPIKKPIQGPRCLVQSIHDINAVVQLAFPVPLDQFLVRFTGA